MKERINAATRAHFLRGAFYLFFLLGGTALAFFRPEATAKISKRTLTFAERVSYQRAIEEVYWRHRIWPKERPDPKPSLDVVFPRGQLETKVQDYLRDSQMLEDHWQRPITIEQLQAEMDRMKESEQLLARGLTRPIRMSQSQRPAFDRAPPRRRLVPGGKAST